VVDSSKIAVNVNSYKSVDATDAGFVAELQNGPITVAVKTTDEWIF